MDFNSDGKFLATGAVDGQVRIYDPATRQIVKTFGRAGWNTKGHSNRVFGCHFSKFDENVLLTGGWDRTVQIWDMRDPHNVG